MTRAMVFFYAIYHQQESTFWHEESQLYLANGEIDKAVDCQQESAKHTNAAVTLLCDGLIASKDQVN